MENNNASPVSDSRKREHLRQQLLLRSLWNDTAPTALQGWLSPPPQPAAAARQSPAAATLRGWQAYVANAHAGAERALAAAFPTVQRLMGEASFAAMARAFWHAHPPVRGDLAWLGEGLPAFIAASDQLATEPYLADSARLDWAVNRCEAAADAPADLASLQLLAEAEPAHLRLFFPPGTLLLRSPHPIVSIWQGHHEPLDPQDPFAPVRAAFASGQGERALVWRDGWRARVQALDEPTAAFAASALLPSGSLATALDAAGPHWSFEAWLVDAVGKKLVSHLSRMG
jgi:hypothetical protein